MFKDFLRSTTECVALVNILVFYLFLVLGKSIVYAGLT